MAKLATLGLSDEQAEAVAGMLCEVEEATATQAEAVIERSRAKTRERVQKWRDNHKSNVTERYETSLSVTKRLVREPARVEDKTSNLEIEPQKEEKKETRESAFEAFWEIYPHKVGKADAKAKFAAAARKVELETLMASLRRYVAKTDDRPWCNPATWLHQERWTDEPATAPPVRAGPSRMNPTLQAAYALKDKLDAVTPSEIEGHHPPPRLVAIGNR